MRIVQLITRPQRRGAEIFAVQLAEQLLKLGHKVWVISIFKGEEGLEYSKNIIQLDLGVGGKIHVNGFKKLSAELARIQPDLVQANASDTLRYAVGVKYFCSWKFKLVYRNANTISSFIRSKTQLYFNKFLHSHVDAVISVSENSKFDYQKLYKPKIITSIPIGIDPKEIDKKQAQEDFQYDKDYLLYVGSLVPEKDPLGLLKIYCEVIKTNPEIDLVYLGSGPLKKDLEYEIAVLGLINSIKIIPSQKNIFPILYKSRALLMPSKIEGLPAVILEAMYCEIPVIAYNVGGIFEVLKNKETGWLVDSGDSKSFELAISEVLNDPLDEIKKNISTARELVLRDFQIEEIAKRFEDFYFFVSNPKYI